MAWAEGESGNPGGRPKKKLFAEALRLQLLRPIDRDAEGKPDFPKLGENPRYLDIVANKLISAAIFGTSTVQAAKEIRDTLDGKPAQSLNHSGMIATTHEDLLKQLDCQPTEDDDSDGEADPAPAA